MRAVLPVLAAVLASAAALPAQTRLVRNFAEDQGLVAPPVWSLAQDSAGFLWIGAEGGLFRFDGVEMRRWAGETIRDVVVDVTISQAGRIVARQRNGGLFEIGPGDEARPIILPIAQRPVGPGSVTFDRDGILWAIVGDSVVHATAEGGWRSLNGSAAPAGELWRVDAGANGVLVTTDSGVWQATVESPPRPLLHATRVADAVTTADGRQLVLLNGPPAARIVELGPDGPRDLLPPDAIWGGRAISLVERGGSLWVAVDRHLVRIRAGEPDERLGLEQGVESGGPLLVDREGSLWLGSFSALHQFPEPETRVWGEDDGLSSRHTRFLARSGSSLYVLTWRGSDRLFDTPGGRRMEHVAWPRARSHICTAGDGAVWTSDSNGVLEVRDTAPMHWPGATVNRTDGCAADREGGVWFAGPGQLAYADPRDRRVREVATPPGSSPGEELAATLVDSRGRLWVRGEDRLCSAPTASLATGAASWQCDTVPDLGWVRSMVELSGGTLWAASERQGVLALRDGLWQRIAPDQLATPTLFALRHSPRGGVWVLGHGAVQRVRERGDGWEVLEQLTRWHGLPSVGGSDLVEDDDGTLWIATTHGVVQVPPEVRFATRSAPPVVLLEARVNGEPAQVGDGLRLPHDRDDIELRFAALSFRDPAALRHQVRLGPDQPWTDASGRPSFRWTELSAGAYSAEYRASLDGVEWSASPARVRFRVLPAWYRTPWFLLLAAALAAALVWLIYRARVAHLVGLERQRTRIAMDLHDEVGSGLASVGILSGVLAADGLNEGERRAAALEIAAAAEDLGYALSDIVWSLDPRTATLGELAARLAEQGNRLCAEGVPEFSAEFPERWPETALDAALRRNVLLIGLEALHNAVRHGSAASVVLSLLPDGPSAWRLAVRDDGAGIRDASATVVAATGRGRGLHGMRRRASEIGAQLDIDSRCGEGTVVALTFDLAPRPLRLRPPAKDAAASG